MAYLSSYVATVLPTQKAAFFMSVHFNVNFIFIFPVVFFYQRIGIYSFRLILNKSQILNLIFYFIYLATAGFHCNRLTSFMKLC